MLSIISVEARIDSSVGIAPVGKPVQTVGIEHRVKNNDDVLELLK